MAVKRGIFVAPFDELVEPRLMAELAQLAEARGWDGFFIWDHIRYRAPVRAVADPWVTLSAIAYATNELRLGPMVTPLARRRIQKLARETVTLDHLSGGRLTLGVGLGSNRSDEFGAFGDETDPRERARLLDRGLERLTELWGGEFEPGPLQRPRIPVWVASRWPNRRPVRRAAKWDGLFPIELPGPNELAVLAAEVHALRDGNSEPFDFVIEVSPGEDLGPWEAAGATWVLNSFGPEPREAQVRAQIEAGPG